MRENILYFIVLMLFIFSTIPFYVEVNEINTKLLNIAHRGASGYAPENTISAFDKAIEMNVDYIELDVQMTKDGYLIVIHDPQVNRTTNGKGFIKDLTLNEIKRLDAGSWYSDDFKGEKIPTFKEILERYAEDVGLLIEIKNPSLYPGIELKVAEAISSYTSLTSSNIDIKIQSFDLTSLKALKVYLPNIESGLIVKRLISYRDLLSLSKNTDFINVQKRFISRHLVLQAHQLGLKIYAWTINDLQDLKFLLLLGIDGAIVDYPELIFQTRQIY
ncbi:glycerophosphodiester phosphodiesterase [Litchfieldia alkalitelluris]|uniref:glycerophosphodiester phosphodiesterase n=1 Tax=Litchfieldia alkalitelluris TaxID=304268 RepID=UPI0009988048|nr:glycerophosphodiester phosphodiesterase family protein [Litchfieldia alkalitelluris]